MKGRKLLLAIADPKMAFAFAFVILALLVLSLRGFSDGEVKHIDTQEGALSVYLPEDYKNSTARYPVLYLLHGTTGDDLTFLGGGYQKYSGAMSDANVAVIVDKLSQERKIKPLIVACPDNFSSYVVSFVDTTFRTISERISSDCWALSGWLAFFLYSAFAP